LLVFPLIFYLLVFAFCGLGETTEVTMNVVDEDGAEQPWLPRAVMDWSSCSGPNHFSRHSAKNWPL